jgi:Tfp pilus assembly protein PilF
VLRAIQQRADDRELRRRHCACRESAEKVALAYYTRASAYLMSGDNKRAIEDYGEPLKHQPADAMVPAALSC